MNQQAVSRRSEILDIFLFFVLSAFTAIFAVSGYFKSSPFPEQFSFLCQHFRGILNLLMVVCLLIYVFLFLFFIQRRYLKTGKRISPWLISIFLLFVILRGFTDFSSPYEPFVETFVYPSTHQIYNIAYQGITFSDRIVNFLCEVGILSFFLLPFTYLGDLKKNYLAGFFIGILFCLVLFCLVCNIYSYITEGKKIIFNIKMMFFKESGDFYYISSFTSHKNVYGFFLWIGTLALLLLSILQEKYMGLNLALMVYFLISAIIIKSRFPIGLITLTILFYLLYTAIAFHKKNRSFSVFSYSVLGMLSLFLIIIFTFGKDTSLCQKVRFLITDFTNLRTIFSRKELTMRALSLINSPFHLFFGYGKEQYIYFFDRMGVAIMSQDIVDLSHNAFLDIIVSYGITGFLPILFINVSLVLKNILLITRRNWHGIIYIFFFLTITIYGFVESRALLGVEGSGFFFLLIYLVPVFIDASCLSGNSCFDIYHSLAMKKVLTKKLG